MARFVVLDHVHCSFQCLVWRCCEWRERRAVVATCEDAHVKKLFFSQPNVIENCALGNIVEGRSGDVEVNAGDDLVDRVIEENVRGCVDCVYIGLLVAEEIEKLDQNISTTILIPQI